MESERKIRARAYLLPPNLADQGEWTQETQLLHYHLLVLVIIMAIHLFLPAWTPTYLTLFFYPATMCLHTMRAPRYYRFGRIFRRLPTYLVAEMHHYFSTRPPRPNLPPSHSIKSIDKKSTAFHVSLFFKHKN